MKKKLLFAKRLFLLVLSPIVLYLVLALLGMLIPASTKNQENKGNIPIFITSNGFHTAVIIPWAVLKPTLLQSVDNEIFKKYENYQYINLGWGDEGFYMGFMDNQSPTLATSLAALFLPTSSLMYLEFYDFEPQADESTIRLMIDQSQLENLVSFIENSFQKTAQQQFIFHSKGYGADDYFFKGQGSYHLFSTCNSWTNNALKAGSLPASLWSPFAQGVMWRMKK